MGGGTELEGLITEAEIGLFAMKRDQVVREMRPFDNADLKLDAIQLAPMAIYNCITYDLLDNCPDPDALTRIHLQPAIWSCRSEQKRPT